MTLRTVANRGIVRRAKEMQAREDALAMRRFSRWGACEEDPRFDEHMTMALEMGPRLRRFLARLDIS